MSTWHQDQVKHRFIHPTKWTVVEDAPHTMMCISRFDSHEEAEARLALIKPTLTGSYIVVPETVWARITGKKL